MKKGVSKEKFVSLMSMGSALLIFGLLGVLAPALTEIGEGMLAAGALFCAGAYAGRKGVRAAPWVLTIAGIAVGAGLAGRMVKKPSHQRVIHQITLPAPDQ